MPIYEYECSHCRYYFEVIQKLSDARLKKCPSCGKNTLKKLISAPVFRLKGSGWYETDFKSDPSRSAIWPAVTRTSRKPRKQPTARTPRLVPPRRPVLPPTGTEAKAGAASEAKSDSAAESKVAAKGESKVAAPAKASGASITPRQEGQT